MRISTELIRRCSSKNLLPVQGSEEDILERITHLYLQEQHIRKIENLEYCKNLIALYLYENKIEKIENLDHLESLNCLYLHWNAITRIENVDMLSQLTVLNLAHNSIWKVEGLEALSELRELYIQYQNLPEGQSLKFDPETINWLSDSLRVLNVSGNRLESLCPVKPLVYLEHFVAEENEVSNIQDLLDVVSNWKYILNMKLSGNPVCSLRKYRDNVVVSCLELEELDGKVISQPYRNFLLNWRQCQTLQNLKRESYEVLKPFLETRKLTRQFIEWKNNSVIENTTTYYYYWFNQYLLPKWEALKNNCKHISGAIMSAILNVPRGLRMRNRTCIVKCLNCESHYYLHPPQRKFFDFEYPVAQVFPGYWLHVETSADVLNSLRRFQENSSKMHIHKEKRVPEIETHQMKFPSIELKGKRTSDNFVFVSKERKMISKRQTKPLERAKPYSCPYFLRSKTRNKFS